MFLLDTVVLSETVKRQPNRAAMSWLSAQGEASTFLSVLSLGEVARGIAAVRSRDPVFAQRLSAWLETLLLSYGARVLPLSAAAALHWGELSAVLGNSSVDFMIAATALEHDLTLVTRNTSHFAGTGVRLLNPFSG